MGRASRITDERLASLYASEGFGGERTMRAKVIRELIDEIRALRRELVIAESPVITSTGPTGSQSRRQNQEMPTELLYLRDSSLPSFDAMVVNSDEGVVELDRTAFYVTGGGQPHDTGVLRWHGGEARVIDVRKRGDSAWHTLDGAVPPVGAAVTGEIDWDRRYALMRTHTALHVLCGVIWNSWGKAVTGGDMQPLTARMDFEFDPLPEGFAADVEARVNAELAADRPVEVTFLPRGQAIGDADLIRTKVNLIPETVSEIRVVDIVGLDKQADGGTHVRSTNEVGRIRVVKTESKGKGNKRIRIEVLDS